MKKILALLIATVMIAAVFAGCAGGTDSRQTDVPDITGDWSIESETVDNLTLTREQILETGLDMTYTFESGGKVKLSSLGAEFEGTYTQEGNTVTVTMNGGDLSGQVDGDAITIEESNVVMVFKKQ